MTTAKVKRTYKITIVIDGAKQEFSPGMGIGVIASEEVTFDLPAKQYDSPMFTLNLADHQDRLMREVVKATAEEVK